MLPEKSYRAADDRENTALSALADTLSSMDSGLTAEDYMTAVFAAGKENGYEKNELRTWFKALYQILLGQDQGPRFGSFIALYGSDKTVTLIRDALDNKLAKTA